MTIIIVIHIAIIIIIIIYFFPHSPQEQLPSDIYNFAGDIVLDENITITTNSTTKTKEGKQLYIIIIAN